MSAQQRDAASAAGKYDVAIGATAAIWWAARCTAASPPPLPHPSCATNVALAGSGASIWASLDRFAAKLASGGCLAQSGTIGAQHVWLRIACCWASAHHLEGSSALNDVGMWPSGALVGSHHGRCVSRERRGALCHDGKPGAGPAARSISLGGQVVSGRGKQASGLNA